MKLFDAFKQYIVEHEIRHDTRNQIDCIHKKYEIWI